jgi:DNA-binding response OmpR family regulator
MADRVHILAVDDEQDIREILRILLESRGYAVACAANGDEAVSHMEQHPETDLVIMDIMMPGLNGIEACAQIREHSSAPILFLTAKTLEDDKAQAYGAGGDDYLGKPFSQAELLMKVESLVRRYRIYRGKPKQVEAPAMKVSKRLVLCEEKGYVIRDGEVIPLTNKEVEILRFFMDRPGRVIDARMLYEGVWRDKYLPSSTNTVMVHILNLRKKLESDYTNPTLIRTVWGKGYQLDEEE